MDDIELLDGADHEFDLEAVRTGQISPEFVGSALTNFGVEPFLKEFLRLAPSPLSYRDRISGELVDPSRPDFSGFVFKIQANMESTIATALRLSASAPAGSSAAWTPGTCRAAARSSSRRARA